MSNEKIGDYMGRIYFSLYIIKQQRMFFRVNSLSHINNSLITNVEKIKNLGVYEFGYIEKQEGHDPWTQLFRNTNGKTGAFNVE